ncbi:MAG: hypothetical protein RXP77_03150 [Nitrososphaeria archaeon]
MPVGVGNPGLPSSLRSPLSYFLKASREGTRRPSGTGISSYPTPSDLLRIQSMAALVSPPQKRSPSPSLTAIWKAIHQSGLASPLGSRTLSLLYILHPPGTW